MAELPVSPDEMGALATLFGPDLVADPYPAFRQWRAERPVSRPHERLFVLSRFEDCEAVLADASFGHDDSRSRVGAGGNSGKVNARSFLAMNPPDHTRLRRLVARAFTPSRVRGLAPHIEAIVDKLLDGLDERFDLVEQLALPLPVEVISELLGVAPGDRAHLVAWSAALTRALDPGFLVPEGERAHQLAARDAFAGYLRSLVSSRRRAPGDDLMSALVQVHDEGDALSEDELISTCMLLLVAGHETTRGLIGAGVLALLRHPGELARLQDEPQLVERAVEEVLRYDPPVQLIAREALRDSEVAGTTIPAGAFVLLLLGAANRDDAQFEDPDRFDVSRDARRHLTFGHGIHFCLGAPLARLEASVALRRLLPKLSQLRIDGVPEWKPHTVLRGVEHLWLADAGVAPVKSGAPSSS